MLIKKIPQSLLIVCLLCLAAAPCGSLAKLVSPDEKHKRVARTSKEPSVESQKTLQLAGAISLVGETVTIRGDKVDLVGTDMSLKHNVQALPPASIVETFKVQGKVFFVFNGAATVNVITKLHENHGRADSDNVPIGNYAKNDYNAGKVAPVTVDVSDIPASVKTSKTAKPIDKKLIEQSKLDQGLIEAQINDVFSSSEFLKLQQSAEFSEVIEAPKLPSEKTDNDQLNEPEALLNQLDESDLMDYVAEDDLWKEQLTIEDEP
jgi:hypothetical protein